MAWGRRSVVAAVGIAAAVLLAACGGGAPPAAVTGTADGPQSDAQPYEALRDGGTLRVALKEIPAQLNIDQGDTSGYSENLWVWSNPTLTGFALDGTPVFNPDYLSDVHADVVDGNTRVTYTINPKAFFNDGTPIDEKTFEGTWKALRQVDPSYFTGAVAGFDRIASVTQGADARQVVVTFKGGFVGWQALFRYVLHPAATATADAFNRAYIDNPHPEWGAGPYMVSKLDRQAGTAVYVRNPKWWGKPGRLDTVTFTQMDSQASINAFRNGQIDYTNVGTRDRLAQVQGMKGIDLRRGETGETYVLNLNAQSPVLADKAVRKAILESIDRAQLAAVSAQGLGFTEPLSGSLALIPSERGYQDNMAKVVAYDPVKAASELDAAGWAPGPDGIRARNGSPLAVTYVVTSDDPTTKARTLAMVAMLRKVDVRVDVQQVPSSDFAKVINGKQYDMFADYYEQPDPFGVRYLCDIYCTKGSNNLSGTGTAAQDAQLQALSGVADPAQQTAQGNALELQAMGEFGILTGETLPVVYAVRSGLANVGALPFTNALPETIGWQK